MRLPLLFYNKEEWKMAVGILIERNGGKDVKKAFGNPLKEIPCYW